MPVAIEMTFTGATLDQYDQVMRGMGLAPGGGTPPGALFHWAAETAGGLRVVDVWETREQFEQFAQTDIGPQTQQAGFEGPPEMVFYDVHSYLSAS